VENRDERMEEERRQREGRRGKREGNIMGMMRGMVGGRRCSSMCRSVAGAADRWDRCQEIPTTGAVQSPPTMVCYLPVIQADKL
jgi:hypothetical protein